MSKGSVDNRKLALAQLQGIMRQDAGRAVLARILTHTGFFGTSWDADPRTHAMREGKRLEGLWLLQEMREADSELAKLIITEYLRHADQ